MAYEHTESVLHQISSITFTGGAGSKRAWGVSLQGDVLKAAQASCQGDTSKEFPSSVTSLKDVTIFHFFPLLPTSHLAGGYAGGSCSLGY